MIEFVRFGNWAPQGSSFGEGLELALNTVPTHMGYRPLRKASPQASMAAGPVTGAMVHIWQQQVEVQELGPDSDDTVGDYEAQAGGDLYLELNQEVAEDGRYIYVTGAPSAAEAILTLEDPEAPGVDTGHSFKWRYRIANSSSTWTVKCGLYEGATLIVEDTDTGSNSTSVVERELLLSTGEASGISDYTNLKVKFTATVAGSNQTLRPASDSFNSGWRDEGGATSSLYASIDESSASDADYIESEPLSSGGGTKTYICNLDTSGVDPLSTGTHTIRYRYQATNTGTKLVVQLRSGGTTIKTVSHTSIATSWTDGSFTLSAAEIAEIADYGDLKLVFVASWPTSATSTEVQYLRPVSDVENPGNWDPNPSSPTTLYDKIDEASLDINDYIEENNLRTLSSTEFTCTVALTATAEDPEVDSGFSVDIAAVATTSGSLQKLKVGLYEGSTLIESTTINLGTSVPPSTINWEPLSIAPISDWSNLRIKLTNDADWEYVKVYWLQVKSPEPRRVRVSWAEVETPPPARADFAWFRMFLPDPDTTYKGDVPTIHCGTAARLYTADSGSFTDVSQGGSGGSGYATAGLDPTGWNFAQYGAAMIATNYVDEVQVKEPADAEYSDLFTSTAKPKARFVVPWQSRLLLGDINDANYGPDHVWLTASENAADADISDTTLAGPEAISSRPGGITGLVGGQSAAIFKRNSIHSMVFIGGQYLFRIGEVSKNVGTPFGRSIVGDDTEFYFYSGGGFYAGSVEGGVRRIGDEAVTRWLLDYGLSDGALESKAPAGPAQEEQTIIGARCPHSRMIYWSTQVSGDPEYRHSRGVLYNPLENRWSPVYGPANVAYVATYPNSVNSDQHIFKGLIGFDWDGTDTRWFKLSDKETYPITFRTKVRVFDPDLRSRITRVKPTLSSNATSAVSPTINYVRVTCGPESTLTEETDQMTLTSANRNTEGWYSLGVGLAGWFWRFEVEIASLGTLIGGTLKTLHHFEGMHVDRDPDAGKRGA